jgi:hypothetical protein
MVLRQTQPDLPRGFKVPLYPVIPILSIAGCIWIIQDLRPLTIYIFIGVAAASLVWYAAYGIRHSALARPAVDEAGGTDRLISPTSGIQQLHAVLGAGSVRRATSASRLSTSASASRLLDA